MSDLNKALAYSKNSFFITKRIVENLKSIPESCLPTLLAIAYHAPNSRPPIDLIVEMTGYCYRSVRYQIKKLESLGIIKVHRAHRKANEYEIILGGKPLPLTDNLGGKLEHFRGQELLPPLGANSFASQHTITYNKHSEDFLKIDLEERKKMADEMGQIIKRTRSK